MRVGFGNLFSIKRNMRLFKRKERENKELKAILDCLQRDDETEIRLTVKSLVMYESMTGNKFSKAMSEPEEMLPIMYCAFVCSTGIEISLGAFVEMLDDPKFSKKINGDLDRLRKFTEQFKSEKCDGEGEKNPENVDISISDMADKLIFYYGVDARYVMNDMQLWELNHFLSGAEEQYKSRMEEQRMWTFLQVAPNIDLKKCKSPEKFLPFPWDEKDRKQRKDEQLRNETARAKSTIGMTINLKR